MMEFYKPTIGLFEILGRLFQSISCYWTMHAQMHSFKQKRIS